MIHDIKLLLFYNIFSYLTYMVRIEQQVNSVTNAEYRSRVL